MAPWGSTVITEFHRNLQQQIVGRNKQESKESRFTQNKAGGKISAVKSNNSNLVIIHSLSFLNMEKIPIRVCGASLTGQNLSVHHLRKHQSTQSISWLPLFFQDRKKERKEEKVKIKEEINQSLRLDYSCCVLSGWMYRRMHAALRARRAWPSFSCRCVSTGEACQTPGSPFQRCQRTFQVLSGARIENKGGENKGGEGYVCVCVCVGEGSWLAPKLLIGSLQKWQEEMDTAHSLLEMYLCNMLLTQNREMQY